MDDGLPLPTITYTNGPGWIGSYVVDENGNAARRNLTDDDVTSYDYVHSAGALRYSETHGGDDVALFAVGEKTSRLSWSLRAFGHRRPMSHLFQRTHEQSFIAHAMAYAACIGPNLDHCAQP
ncbi:hypothetical protein HAZT_HAZT010171 [Hyalella azteca]|uniref:alkaline phosphatase n=1 Tax=Hyalella azteca TaxID=294128 RepID=A0A6A0H3U7_HYAAZ|nr:hypothetical protein HAZT_HAZT010171 [Hyalella azteca]